jgi:2-polyprenyl-3-methyl-5-hydroxy-6-metoxy-1,4-benzoquinol methylase
MNTTLDLREQVRVYSGAREDLWPYIPVGTRRVLDVGCAQGQVGAALKKAGRAREVVGLELSLQAAAEARQHLDDVIEGDIEAAQVPYSEGYFDLLLYADVLEHLKNPWDLVARQRRLLRQGGRIVVSLPNIGHYSTLLMLLRQQWRYQELGIMDYTHLRFFTRPGVLDLLRRAGYAEVRLYRRGGEGPKQRLARALTLGYSTDFFIPGFIAVARTP